MLDRITTLRMSGNIFKVTRGLGLMLTVKPRADTRRVIASYSPSPLAGEGARLVSPVNPLSAGEARPQAAYGAAKLMSEDMLAG